MWRGRGTNRICRQTYFSTIFRIYYIISRTICQGISKNNLNILLMTKRKIPLRRGLERDAPRGFLVFPRRHHCSIFVTHWAMTLFSNVRYTSSLTVELVLRLRCKSAQPIGNNVHLTTQSSLFRVSISGVRQAEECQQQGE